MCALYLRQDGGEESRFPGDTARMHESTKQSQPDADLFKIC